MAVLSLDHVNIRTPDPAATMAFFQDALGMRATAPMGGPVTGQGGWVLDDEGRAVLHVGTTGARYPGDAEIAPMRGSGAIDHVALRCSGFQETKQRLERLEVPFRANYVAQIELHQLFVEEPTGIKIELNFPAG